MRRGPTLVRFFGHAAILGGCLLLGAAGEAGAAIPASERAALIALYNSTGGTGWTNRTNWLDAAGTECTWYGVTCDGSAEHVTALTLDGNHLNGPIPTEIGNLTALTTLLLRRNWLSGPIPPGVWSLTKLVTLALRANYYLTGPIPAEIGNLTALEGLDLSDSGLRGPIPPQIGNLTNLGFLSLAGNYALTGPIPPEIGNLTKLHLLYLHLNQLTGAIPPQIGNLRLLEKLDLSENELAGPIPPEIGKLTSLDRLVLAWNHLTGPIPPEIANLRRLSFLDLGSNELSGWIPRQIGNLTDLTWLTLRWNQLTGPIPPEVGNPTRLSRLDLSGNHLTGLIPPQIGNLRQLSSLDLRDNQLGGSIPAEIGNLTGLSNLFIASNQLRGPIPTTLMNLAGLLGYVDLYQNALYTNDAALRAFLELIAAAGWEDSQTVAPTGLAAGVPGPDTVPLSWLPIVYTANTGGYRIWYGTTPGGPYNLAGTTADKTVSASTVSGLSPGTRYYFALDTVTEPNPANQNTVVSDRTAEVSATTTAGGVGWHGLTVVREGPGTVSSSPGGIVCGGACSATFAPGTPVRLTAVPEAGSTFLGWGSACAGTALTCDLTMDATQTVTASFSPPGTSLYTVTPCRVFDSRDVGLGGPVALGAGTDNAVLVGGYCGIPLTAKAVSLNVTAVSATAGGHLRLYPSATPRPSTSSINYAEGQTRANNAVVSLGADGALAVYVNQPSGTVHVVIDVNGYFQ